MPLIIFHGSDTNTSAPLRWEEKLFDSRVVVKFNPKGYANSTIMLFWLEFMLLPVLSTGPTLLVMDLFKSHSTQEIKDWLRTHGIVPSLVPGGCTGLVQPLDVSVNRPFKDILKQVIDDAVDLAERQTPAAGKKNWQSAASKMRVMMTKCVGDAWEIFNQKNRDVVIRSFRCLGSALPIDGSCDNEISIKGLNTTILMEGLKNWERAPAVESSSEGTSDNPETDTSEDEDEPLTKFLSPLTSSDSHTAAAAGPSHTAVAAGLEVDKLSAALTATRSTLPASSSTSSDDDMPLKTAIRGNRRGRPRGRGRGSQRSRGKSSNNSRFLKYLGLYLLNKSTNIQLSQLPPLPRRSRCQRDRQTHCQ